MNVMRTSVRADGDRFSDWRRLLPAQSDFRWLAIVCIAYVAAAQLGFQLAFATKQVTAVWPPTGIALAAFLLRGRSMWPGVFLGAFISNAMSHEPLTTAAGIAVGNTLGPLAGAYLLHRFGKIDTALSGLRDVLWLAFLGAALAMTITATNGVANLAFGGLVPWRAYPSVWWVWWVGDAMGALLVAPVILTVFAGRGFRWDGARRLELAALGLASSLLTAAVFSTSLPLAYPVFPIVIWAALRFSQRETAVAILIVSAVAVWQTVHGRGPFVSGSIDSRLVLLVTFMAVLAVTGLALGALSAERRRAEVSLRQANDELESRVQSRTAELVETNAVLERRTAELARKNEEVEAFVYIVSHDLRAPLVNLQGFSRELKHSCDDLDQALSHVEMSKDVAESVRTVLESRITGSLRYIGASVSKFERLIDALLVLSRTGQQEYRFETIDVRNVVEATLASFQQTISASGTRITLGSIPNAKGDVTAVGQVFSNLIDNALKYLEPSRLGEIEIAGMDEGPSMHYWVRDNGVGVPASAGNRLFHVFQRFHPKLADGDGIGLAAIKRIVERHNGRIWLDRESGIGSTFHFTLPAPSAMELP